MWGKRLVRLESTPFDELGGAIRTSTHSPQAYTIALNGARDEFPYIISDIYYLWSALCGVGIKKDSILYNILICIFDEI